MKPSVWTSYFAELTPAEAIGTIGRAGWRYAELSDEHSAWLLQAGRPDEQGRYLNRVAAEQGVQVLQGHLWLMCDLAGPDQAAIVDILKRWLDLYLNIGIRAAVLHPAGRARYDAGDDPEVIEAAAISTLQALTAHLAGTELVICLENLFTHARTCSDLQRMIQAAGSTNLGICLDTGHLNLAGRDQGAFIRQAGRQLCALHVADNEGWRDQHLMPYGPGTVDWRDVITALRAIVYTGLFNYEIPGERRAPPDVLLAKLDYLKQVTRDLFAS
jgi:sugar phosphate isomerase/epimerase